MPVELFHHHVAIIADDLTGACDSAVGFAAAGYRAEVLLDPDARSPADAEVVAFDTETRNLAPEVAAAHVQPAARRAGRSSVVLKKIDSTLRGPICAELAATIEVSDRMAVIVAPAFPAYGRTTLAGMQLLDGVPVHETSAGSDPVAPARSSDLRELLAPIGREPAMLGRGERLDRARLRAAMERRELVIADIEVDSDLDALIAAAGDPSAVLWVGSTGLARALGRALTPSEPSSISVPAAQRPLVVVGSLNPRTREQLAVLAAEPGVAVELLESPGRQVPMFPAGSSTFALASANRDLGAPPDSELALGVAATLAHAAARIVKSGDADGLVLTGGDTAIAVARALGAHGVRIVGEVTAGVPMGILGGRHAIPIVTKAGGFGEPTALVDSVRALTAAVAVR